MVQILAAVDDYGKSVSVNRRRMRALVLLLRYSGLRIGDAVTLSSERIDTDKLFLYTSKAGTPVYCPLPSFVITALDAATDPKQRFYFWSGNGKVNTITGDWQGKLKTLFERAKVPSGHAHRFRDTFATELLLAGVPLERVSNSPWALEHSHHRASLLALGTVTAGAVRARCAINVECLGACYRGYIRGTRREHSPQLIQMMGDNLAEREGFEPSVQVLARTTV